MTKARKVFPAVNTTAAIALLFLQQAFGAVNPSTLQKGAYNSLSYAFPNNQSISFDLYVPSSFSTSAHLS